VEKYGRSPGLRITQASRGLQSFCRMIASMPPSPSRSASLPPIQPMRRCFAFRLRPANATVLMLHLDSWSIRSRRCQKISSDAASGISMPKIYSASIEPSLFFWASAANREFYKFGVPNLTVIRNSKRLNPTCAGRGARGEVRTPNPPTTRPRQPLPASRTEPRRRPRFRSSARSTSGRSGFIVVEGLGAQRLSPSARDPE
jgi:hypothetical protein